MTDRPASLSFRIRADRRAPSTVRRAVEDAARAWPEVRLGSAEVGEVCAAVHEATTNIVRHGLGADGSRRFSVTVESLTGGLAVVLTDDGPEYELGHGRPPAPEALAESGYGVHIMQSWFDEVRLERRFECNVLRLVRRCRQIEVRHA